MTPTGPHTVAMDAGHQNCPLTEALMNTVDALVVIADPEGRILQFNRACESVTGYSAADVVGRSLVDTLVPVEQRRDVAGVLDQLSASGTNRFENDWITADGRRRRIIWSNATMTDPMGRVTAVVGTGTDITDQRLLESRLAQADRLESIGRLASGIAHDFNNALTSLCLRVERLATRDLDGDSRIDVDSISHMIGRTRNLITELLSFSSPHRPTPERLGVRAEIERLRGVITDLAGGDIEFVTAFTAERDDVSIDPVGFEQAITNLVMNACDAMPEGGRLSMATTPASVAAHAAPSADVPSRLPAGPYVRLSVTDDGTGIDPADLGHVFDPYFTTKPAGRGTGLGLATTYATVTQGGGAITVSSEPGCGTTFDVWLPLAAEHHHAQAAAAAPTTSGEGEDAPCLALVVDDDADVQCSLVDELGRLGCEAIAARGGEQALAHLDTPIDLLITDLHLPDIDGVDVAARFRRHRPEMPVIFASGDARRIDALPADATVLRKPCSTIDLIEAIRSVRGGRWPHAGSRPAAAAE